MQHNTETERARAERIFRRREERKADVPDTCSQFYSDRRAISRNALNGLARSYLPPVSAGLITGNQMATAWR